MPESLGYWLRFAALAPVTLLQGLHLKATAPRMPTRLQTGDGGTAGRGEPRWRLLICGESPVLGVGCSRADESVSAQLACWLAERRGPVAWRVIGANGARAGDVAAMLVTQRAVPVSADKIAVVMLGVNDATRLTTLNRWHEHLVAIRTRLRARGCARVFLAPVPPVGDFTLLPRPLRDVLGRRARMLGAAQSVLERRYADVSVLDTDFPKDPQMLAEDGFHPAPVACRWWAQQLGSQIVRALDQP